MAKEFDTTNSGAFFKNFKKKTPKHPDYTGSLNVEGTEFWLSVWNKESKDGKPYCSVSIQKKEAIPGKPETPKTTRKDDMDDEIPF